MSVEQVARVLKEIKSDCYRNGKLPEYYTPFFDTPAEFSFFEITTLLEEIEKNKNLGGSVYEQKLYEYLVADQEKYGNDFATKYVDELVNLFEKN